MDGWDTNPDGTIKVRPTMGWSTATVPLGGLVRLEYADTPEDIDQGRPKAVQLHMNASQARELGQALLRMADKVDAQETGTSQ